MVTLTDNAVTAVKQAISKSGKEGAGFRIMTRELGCAGLKYLIGLDSSPREDDIVVETCGMCVFIDPMSAPLLSGVSVDFVEEAGRAGFSFDNPNVTSSCSCSSASRSSCGR
jgi:iron-sulfur cluster assembly protein